MRSPLKEVMTIYDVSREKGQVIRLPDAVNYLIQAYGNYEILYSSNNGGINAMPFEPPPISEPDPECIGSDYYANANGYYYLTKDKVYVQLTDFRIKVTKRRIKTNVNGRVEDEGHFILYYDEGFEQKETILYNK